MTSADFRIIPHQVAEAVNPAAPDLYRYRITYATTDQPRYVALDDEGRMILVNDELSAVRFGSIEAAEKRLSYALEHHELQAGGFLPQDLESARP
jgi:hypothetical protein